MTPCYHLILVPPGELGCLRGWAVGAAHLSYRITPDLRLLRGESAPLPRGGVMVISGCPGAVGGSPLLLCRQVEGECASRGYQGILLDWDRPCELLARAAQGLEELCRRRGLRLYVPEWCAPRAPESRVLISTALSGGTLRGRLEEAAEKLGRERVVPALERVAEDFVLPALTGCGRPLAREELERMRGELAPAVYFSRELCARYFTYRDREGGVHFVLFDDPDTLKRKLEVIRGVGVEQVLIPWREVCHAPETYGLRPLSGISPLSRKRG